MPARITEEERERIRTMIKSGYTINQIHDLTGRSQPAIQAIRNELKNGEYFDDYHVGGFISRGVPCPVIEKKAETEEKSKKESALVMTKKVFKFTGVGTMFEYTVGSNSDELVIRNDGFEFRVKLDMIENFATELLDVIDQTDEIKKLVL